jgi:integrase/recombinase XerD
MEIVPYTVDEIKMMLASVERVKMYQRPGQPWQDRKTLEPERSRAIILLLCDSGLRASELCNIKIGHVDKKLMRIKVFGKGAKERFVYFSAKTAQAIWRYLATRDDPKDSEYLFKNRVNGGRLNRSIVLKGLVAIGNRAGVKGVNIHRFRHFFAIQYLRNRGDVYTLQKIMGHSTLDMVKRYLAIAQSDVDASYKIASPVANLNL